MSVTFAPDAMPSDMHTVRKALNAPELKAIQQNIFAGTANNEEIEHHYRAFDAIDVPTRFKSERAKYAHIKKAGRIALADFIGGAQIITDQLMSRTIEDSAGYDGALQQIYYRNAHHLVQHEYDNQRISDTDIAMWNNLAGYSVDTANDPLIRTLGTRLSLVEYARLTGFMGGDVIVNNITALRALSLGKTIMGEGAKGVQYYVDIQPHELTKGKDDKPAMETAAYIAQSPWLHLSLSDVIMRSGLLLDGVEGKEMYVEQLKNTFGTALSWPTAPDTLLTNKVHNKYLLHDPEAFKTLQEVSFTDALRYMKCIVDYAREHNHTLFQKGRIKGGLHEVLWMLDAYVIRKGLPQEYGTITVNVATEAEDMPFINNPVLKRGVDFVLQDTRNPNKRRLVQVGASQRKFKNKTEKAYHPSIEVFCEQQFNEVNISTLEQKIMAYEDWAEHGFTKAMYDRLKIQDRLLGSVKECFERTGT